VGSNAFDGGSIGCATADVAPIRERGRQPPRLHLAGEYVARRGDIRPVGDGAVENIRRQVGSSGPAHGVTLGVEADLRKPSLGPGDLEHRSSAA
jgi:hypothetical protein